ncbi:helix-turn-helix domain-containing protein [Niveispirillum sp. KHB5.9]|uniref:helix-turn-helix domain-containing protein n=1 Tax=Niveispirillum sp. KHB5.9 TaxID=3400269 RepID=UPI003A84C44B
MNNLGYTNFFMISAAQCRAARALIEISQDDLAAASGVSKASITDFERGLRAPQKRTLRDLLAAFEARGVVFHRDEEQGLIGVSLKTAVGQGSAYAST